MQEQDFKTEYTVASVCCGLGGGAIGYNWASNEFLNKLGSYRSLYGIDVVPDICQAFEEQTGAPAYCFDLFDREQYIDWHGKEPPEDWQEVTPDDIRALSDGIPPDVVFYSAPCKGFSGLLPQKESESKKYQAMNKLYWRVVWLYFEAFPDDPPMLIVSENVPRVKTRGKAWVEKVKKLVEKSGFLFHTSDHCCGELGGLAQERKRNMFVGRNPEKCPVWLYEPAKKPYQSVGDVLGPLPMPGDVANGGPLHRMPRLQWKVWLRLAMIPPGGDWRDLEKMEHSEYRLQYKPRAGAWQVADWEKKCGSVTGGAGVGRSNGVQAVADMRFGCKETRHTSHYRVEQWDGKTGTVTGASHVGNGRLCVSDVRLNDRSSRHPNVYQVVKWDEVGPCVTGTRFGSGAPAVADTRLGCRPRSGTYGVLRMDETAKTIIGSADVHCGTAALADDREGWEQVLGPDLTPGNIKKICQTLRRDNYLGPLASSARKLIEHVDDRLISGYFRVPHDTETGVWVILSPHGGAWHRPLTTYELAMLQSFPRYQPDGRPFQLPGKSDKSWREWIGNAVPPKAAQAIGEAMLLSMMASAAGYTFLMCSTPIWVKRDVDEWIELETDPEYAMVH